MYQLINELASALVFAEVSGCTAAVDLFLDLARYPDGQAHLPCWSAILEGLVLMPVLGLAELAGALEP